MDIKEILREELQKEIINDIVENNLNEEMDFNSILNNVKKYATKGVLTASILTSLLSSAAFSQQQKQQIKNAAQITKPVQSVNFTRTSDPNVVIGKYGTVITMQQYKQSLKDPNNNMKFTSFDLFADYVGGWAHPKTNDISISPYYRVYHGGTISGGDIAILKSYNDPQINKIITRNIAKPGEVPMFSSQDAQSIKQLIAKFIK